MKKLFVTMFLTLGVAPALAQQPTMSPTPLTDEKIKLAPHYVPQESKPDRRPILVGVGLALAGLGLWWNRKQRQQKDEGKHE